MTARDQLRVRVNDELVLEAGTCEKVSGPHGPERLIRSPKTTLFHQVLAYLRAKPDPPRRPSGSVCLQLALEQRRRPWSEQVLPYGVAEMVLITPSRWTLAETSREVRLPA